MSDALISAFAGSLRGRLIRAPERRRRPVLVFLRPMHLTGRRLAQYEVAEEISRGGMGVVYRATDTRLNRDVALKVLPEDLVHDAERRRRFVQEAQAASAIEHPHIAVM